MDEIETQKRALHEAVESFAELVTALDDEIFLGPLGRWSARDVVAHLIGWNRGKSSAESSRSTTSIPGRTTPT
jgi:hypothetical protein